MAMYSSTGSVHDIDFDTLELMCLYIGEYRCFSDTGINLNAKYLFEFHREDGSNAEWPTVHVSRNKEHIDLFAEYGVNLKVICGINGTGKTTILQLLRRNQHAPDDRYFVLFKDKDDKFLCTKNISLINEGRMVSLTEEWSDVNLSNLTSSLLEQREDEFGILLNMASSYFSNKGLFDFGSFPLFTHFNIAVYSERDYREIIQRVLVDSFGIKDDLSFWSLWWKHPLIYCFLHFCQDNTFVTVRGEIAKHMDSVDELIALFAEGQHEAAYSTLNEKVREMLFTSPVSPARKNIATSPEELGAAIVTSMKASEKEQEPRFYAFSEYENVRTQWNELEAAAYEFFSKVCVDNFHINPDIFNGLFYFRPVRIFSNGGIRELDHLSHGEFFTVHTKYALLPRMAQTDAVWFDGDESDKHLHPEWKRRFLHTYLEAIRDTRKMLASRSPDKGYGNKVYSVLLTTHSPFLLSDVPGEHVVYLESSGDLTAIGFSKTRVRSDDMQRSFCGNIGEMFYSNFFMEETIGEFAKQKIEKALKELDGTVSSERREEIKALFGLVGDSLLKSLLNEKLANARVANATN